MQDDITFEAEENTGNAEEKLKKLREKLRQCEADKTEYLNGWQRAKADLINSRKEEETRRETVRRFATESLLLDIIPALDSFDMALGTLDAAFREAPEAGEAEKSWRTGIASIHAQLLAILASHRLSAFDPLGEPFNPERHDSIGSAPVADPKRDHTVVAVLQKGYELDGKVIRPAKVTIGSYTK